MKVVNFEKWIGPIKLWFSNYSFCYAYKAFDAGIALKTCSVKEGGIMPNLSVLKLLRPIWMDER